MFNGVSFVSSSADGNPSFGENAQIFAYELGESSIGAALNDALMEMKIGEIRALIVPSDLAYGKSGFYGKNIPGSKRFVISPNTTIIYELELVNN
ncbi:MAG: FKBP-type peptidyl-prolyl cis-trans isomerase [Bacteroidetes bacterium]|nr:FKBP-type peptidyl-prolyl cis-trans isomerase [Bacteroidota bacterium]